MTLRSGVRWYWLSRFFNMGVLGWHCRNRPREYNRCMVLVFVAKV